MTTSTTCFRGVHLVTNNHMCVGESTFMYQALEFQLVFLPVRGAPSLTSLAHGIATLWGELPGGGAYKGSMRYPYISQSS